MGSTKFSVRDADVETQFGLLGQSVNSCFNGPLKPVGVEYLFPQRIPIQAKSRLTTMSETTSLGKVTLLFIAIEEQLSKVTVSEHDKSPAIVQKTTAGHCTGPLRRRWLHSAKS